MPANCILAMGTYTGVNGETHLNDRQMRNVTLCGTDYQLEATTQISMMNIIVCGDT